MFIWRLECTGEHQSPVIVANLPHALVASVCLMGCLFGEPLDLITYGPDRTRLVYSEGSFDAQVSNQIHALVGSNRFCCWRCVTLLPVPRPAHQ
jgi:hypothetical protein